MTGWIVVLMCCVTIVVGLGTIIVNLCLLGMNVKLYTEFFKERVKNK
jgi:hypothetical protein